jgi:hypothetical protein
MGGCLPSNKRRAVKTVVVSNQRSGNFPYVVYGSFYIVNQTVGSGLKSTQAWETTWTKQAVGQSVFNFGKQGGKGAQQYGIT